jgi:hypothetical protein
MLFGIIAVYDSEIRLSHGGCEGERHLSMSLCHIHVRMFYGSVTNVALSNATQPRLLWVCSQKCIWIVKLTPPRRRHRLLRCALTRRPRRRRLWSP